jgi:hypothetical protein
VEALSQASASCNFRGVESISFRQQFIEQFKTPNIMPMFMTSNDDDHDIKHLDEDAPQL